MNKFVTTVVLLFFLIPTLAAAASENWMYTAEQVTASIVLSEDLELVRTGPSYHVEYVTANVSFVPSDNWRQEVLTIEFKPKPADIEQYAYFRWDSPIDNRLSFKITADVKITNDFIRVNSKTVFPIQEMPDNIFPYTKPTKNINSDDERIIEQASKIVEGDDDLFIAVSKIASWVQENVKYNLSTLNIQASNNASWVFEKREGVCDEITTLFIAMARSLGIPAKFVSGIAYTDSKEFATSWGPHGWAEVYFPGYGWTEWDVTYGEYGFVDPTHIRLKEALDSDDAATKYVWKGRDMDVKASNIQLSADLKTYTGKMPQRYSVSIDAVEDSIDIGSYNVLIATVENLLDSYTTATVYLSQIQEMKTEGPYLLRVPLKPKEKKELYWLVHTDPTLDKNSRYTFPISISTITGEKSSASFTSAYRDAYFSKEDMQKILDGAKKEAVKIYSKSVTISCENDKKIYYEYDLPKLVCKLKNTGNTFLESLDICLEKQCEKRDIGISQESIVAFDVPVKGPETRKLELTAENEEVSKSMLIDIDILDKPSVLIDDLEYPQEVEYSQSYKVAFTLKKQSRSVPNDVVLTMTRDTRTKTWEFQNLTADKKYLIDFEGADLDAGNNTFDITVKFKDTNNKPYAVSESFTTQLINVTFTQKIAIFFKNIDGWLRNLFD